MDFLISLMPLEIGAKVLVMQHVTQVVHQVSTLLLSVATRSLSVYSLILKEGVNLNAGT